MAIKFLKGIFYDDPRFGVTFDETSKYYTIVDLKHSKIVYDGTDFDEMQKIFRYLIKTNENKINYNNYKIIKNNKSLYDLYYNNIKIATLDSYSEALQEMEDDYAEKSAL